MPVNETPCSDCKHYEEVYSPMPGESWNRCSHKSKRIETKHPCKANSYGYAYELCEVYEVSFIRNPAYKWWMRILCIFGIHWHGHKYGGGMGDACQCFICGMDRYGGAIIVHREDK